jgi:hypothetical protein
MSIGRGYTQEGNTITLFGGTRFLSKILYRVYPAGKELNIAQED